MSEEVEQQYTDIVNKCTDQAKVAEAATKEAADDKQHQQQKEQLVKKYMKQAVDMAKALLTQTLQLDTSIIDIELIVPNVNDIVMSDGYLVSCLLDAGCTAVVVDGRRLSSSDDVMTIMSTRNFPRDRLVVHFSSTIKSQHNQQQQQQPTLEEIQLASSLASTISIEYYHYNNNNMGKDHDDNDDDKKRAAATCFVEDLIALRWKLGNGNNNESSSSLSVGEGSNSSTTTSIVVQVRRSEEENDDSFTKQLVTELMGQDHIFGSSSGNVGVALVDPTPELLGNCFTDICVQTDRPDGLYTTVVCTRTGEALGLVYSSDESVVEALRSGRGVYYSRSRRGLWRKGDTSGHYQVLHRIDVDCDGDALRFTVSQRGVPTAAFCHLNTLTCWGDPVGLRHLEQTLHDRLRSAPEGSYTKRLLDDDVLLRNKLVEEAQELSEAQDRQHVAEELADVLYFAMVRAVKAGVSIDDAIAELDRRTRKVTRRKGDSKAFRIAAGQEILNKPKEGR